MMTENSAVPMTIVLNGTSSSGKSSIAAALQQLLPVPVQVSGIDTFLALQPAAMFALPGAPGPCEGFTWSPVEVEGVACWNVTAGARGEALTRAIHQYWAASAAEGLDQVIDHVILNAMLAADLQRRLAPYEPLYVGVRCPLDVIDKRERDRGDRVIGQGRGIGGHVHDYLDYDVEVDTSTTDPDDAARAIASRVPR